MERVWGPHLGHGRQRSEVQPPGVDGGAGLSEGYSIIIPDIVLLYRSAVLSDGGGGLGARGAGHQRPLEGA